MICSLSRSQHRDDEDDDGDDKSMLNIVPRTTGYATNVGAELFF